ncbi:MAG: MFS transporter [Anaeromyxobacter sp.]|nr:MFS transporter [Anaeromyxobacter sp.]MBL0278114.1 MFS transporter [Anaeromyxobacter sp.]
MHRPELRAWALYDWANSAFVCVVVTAVFPIYFATVAARGLAPAAATAAYGLATTVGLVLVAVASPLLGALADAGALKKRLLAAGVALGAGATAGLFLVGPGDWRLAAALFVLANVGLSASFVFYDSLLPHVARPEEVDRVSSAGYALGYLGGGLLLAVVLAWILRPDLVGLPSGPGLSDADATLPTRLGFLAVALWWVAFSIPLLRRVREPPAASGAPAGHPLRAALGQLGRTGQALRRHPQAARLLAAFLVYNDGIGTIIRMATVYGTELGISRGALIGAILLVQFLGIPFAFLFGGLAGRIGAKRSVLLALGVYALISVVGYFMTSAAHFFALAALVAVVQGGAQALSRSLFASLVPRRRSGEFFGFFSVMEKVAGIFGPGLFTVAVWLTGSSRAAILSVIVFFAAGALLLVGVDVEAGQRAARQADAEGEASGAAG